MAKGKKSFVLYADLIHTVEKLPDDISGKLFKHLLRYVNDLNPKTDDLFVDALFEQIKQQLKRDLEKWEKTSAKRSEIGKLGGLKSGEARQTKTNQSEPIGIKEKQNEHDTVNDNVTVINKEDFSLKRVTELFLQKTDTIWIPKYAQTEALKFFNFYESNGWKVGKNKMKSLSGAIGGWIARNEKPELVQPKEKKITW